MQKIKCEFQSDEQLRESYISFVENGGIFVDSDECRLGDKVSLALKLPAELEEMQLTAKVVWINPARCSDEINLGSGMQMNDAKEVVWVMPSGMQSSQEQPKVGLQFTGSSALTVNQKIRDLLD